METFAAPKARSSVCVIDRAAWQQGGISPRDAVRYADSQHGVRMRIELAKPATFSSTDAANPSVQDG